MPGGSRSCAPPRPSRRCRSRWSTTCSTLADAEGLAAAWKFASRARNATVQVRGKAADQLPRDARERAAVAAILQYDPGESDVMLNDYLRSARRARGIVDRIFWE